MSSTAGLAIILANTGKENESLILMLLDALNAMDVNLNPEVGYTELSQGVNPAEMPISTPFTENG